MSSDEKQPLPTKLFRYVNAKIERRQLFFKRMGFDLELKRQVRRRRYENSTVFKAKCTQSPLLPDEPVDEQQHQSHLVTANDCRQLKNDYSQNFVNSGQRPQNFIRDSGIADRFEEYPKLRELIRLKDDLIQKTNCPPFYLQMRNITSENLFSQLDSLQFDVVLLRPSLPDSIYSTEQGKRIWNWHDISLLPIDRLAAQRSFVFIWANSGNGLDDARNCLRRWGFRRCEDICWIKTNRNSNSNKIISSDTGDGIFQRSKEHCLMGIRGTVRRSMDADFIHANVDIDLIIAEEEAGPSMPHEIFDIIEHFCLGRRRLFLFGSDNDIRPGWLTIGSNLSSSNFDPEKYNSFFTSQITTGTTDRIEQLRPKSPPMLPPQSSSPVVPAQAGNKQNTDCCSVLNIVHSLLKMQSMKTPTTNNFRY
ncbi:hypothetical protein GJ496_003195 [Pomphorhynchus laevis]|nr:hypothetical protein GJ496_003195 [Pomphorhynchus laevis]